MVYQIRYKISVFEVSEEQEIDCYTQCEYKLSLFVSSKEEVTEQKCQKGGYQQQNDEIATRKIIKQYADGKKIKVSCVKFVPYRRIYQQNDSEEYPKDSLCKQKRIVLREV